MFIIAEEDLVYVQTEVDEVVSQLAGGSKRVDREVDVGDGICPIVVSGYWVVDTIRIDIRIKK